MNRYNDDLNAIQSILDGTGAVFTEDLKLARKFKTEAEAAKFKQRGWYVDGLVGRDGVSYVVTTYFGACTVYMK